MQEIRFLTEAIFKPVYIDEFAICPESFHDGQIIDIACEQVADFKVPSRFQHAHRKGNINAFGLLNQTVLLTRCLTPALELTRFVNHLWLKSMVTKMALNAVDATRVTTYRGEVVNTVGIRRHLCHPKHIGVGDTEQGMTSRICLVTQLLKASGLAVNVAPCTFAPNEVRLAVHICVHAIRHKHTARTLSSLCARVYRDRAPLRA